MAEAECGEDNFLVKNQDRNRSFYLQGRTWNEWFYGFVEYYNELKVIIDDMIDTCLDISLVTSQIVNSTSPEGIFPSELVQVIEKETFFFLDIW